MGAVALMYFLMYTYMFIYNLYIYNLHIYEIFYIICAGHGRGGLDVLPDPLNLFYSILFYSIVISCEGHGRGGLDVLPDPLHLRQLYPAQRLLGYRRRQPVHGWRRGGGRGGGGGGGPRPRTYARR